MLDIIKNYITSNQIIEKICGPYEPIFATITGSQCSGLTDEFSDIDILILAKDVGNNILSSLVIYYNGVKTHFFVRDVKVFFDTNFKWGYLNLVSGLLWPLYNLKGIVYKNNKYNALLDFFNDNKYSISQYCLYNYLEQEQIKNIIEAGKIEEKDYTKHISHVCLGYFVNNFMDIDISFLKKIKRIKWKNVSLTEKMQAVIYLQSAKKMFNNYDANNFINYYNQNITRLLEVKDNGS